MTLPARDMRPGLFFHHRLAGRFRTQHSFPREFRQARLGASLPGDPCCPLSLQASSLHPKDPGGHPARTSCSATAAAAKGSPISPQSPLPPLTWQDWEPGGRGCSQNQTQDSSSPSASNILHSGPTSGSSLKIITTVVYI